MSLLKKRMRTPAELEIGAVIKMVRKRRGLTVGAMAIELGCGRSAIFKLEGGHRIPTLGLLERIGMVLGYEAWRLLRRAQKAAALKAEARFAEQETARDAIADWQ